jgi:Undecaprenyl-phosphate glucose phosphotransferase
MIGPTVTMLDCFFLVAVGPVIATTVYPWLTATQSEHFWSYAAVSGMFCAVIVPLFSLRGIYNFSALVDFGRQCRSIVSICAMTVALMAFAARQLDLPQQSMRCLAANLACVFVLLLLHHFWWWLRLRRGPLSAGVRPCGIALITPDGRVDDEQRRRLESLGYDIRLQIGLASRPGEAPLRTRTANVLRGAEIDEIVLAAPFELIDSTLVSDLGATPFPIRFLPDSRLADMVGCPFRSNGSAVLFKVRSGPLSEQERWAKRLLDIVVASVGLVVVAPLLLLVAAAIALESPGPIFFKQTRLGFNGVPFKIRKFRSMVVTEDGPTVEAAKRNDARVTRVGRIIRRCSIDELPQLINVLQGEMSIVGPRPHAVAHDQAYDRTVADYAHRQHVKPGLTGWAQINGHRGEIHDPAEMARRLDYDLWYIRNWRFSLDLKIILLTGFALVFTKKAY